MVLKNVLKYVFKIKWGNKPLLPYLVVVHVQANQSKVGGLSSGSHHDLTILYQGLEFIIIITHFPLRLQREAGKLTFLRGARLVENTSVMVAS